MRKGTSMRGPFTVWCVHVHGMEAGGGLGAGMRRRWEMEEEIEAMMAM